MMELFLSHEP